MAGVRNGWAHLELEAAALQSTRRERHLVRKDFVIGGCGKSKGEKDRGRERPAENTKAHRDLLPSPAVATNSMKRKDREYRPLPPHRPHPNVT
jgi:hypothetical protein